MSRAFMVVVVAALAGAAPVEAQRIPLAFQTGVGADIPLGDFADLAGQGTGFAIGSGFQVAPSVAVFVGYSRIRFEGETALGDLVDSGFSAGLSFVLPTLAPRIHPWFGVGGVLHGLDIENSPVQPERWNPGVGLGAGILVPITGNVRVSPNAGYVWYRTDFPGRPDLDVTYLSLGLSVNVSF
jgi:hypothetical protein